MYIFMKEICNIKKYFGLVGRFGNRGTIASTSGRPCSQWPSSGPSWRTRVSGLEQASCR
jgi:hypothetical protein